MPKIIEIQTDIIRVRFNSASEMPMIGHILKTKKGSSFIVERIDENNIISAVIIDLKETVVLDQELINTKKGIQGPIGDELFGNVFNALGEVIGENKDVKLELQERVENKTKDFTIGEEMLETGIKVIDFLTPIFKGNKLGIFGGAGVGKTVVIKEIIFNTSSKRTSKSIFVGIGERSREGEELYKELEESNLLSKTALFFAGMNEFAGARFNIIKSALITAEHLRDEQKQDVVMFVDNVFRYVQAGSEVSSSLGRRPSAVGYQSTLLSEVSEVQERISNSRDGSITSFQSVYVVADDITDPAAVAIFNHLDGSIVLDRNVAAENIYPAISITESTSSNTTRDKIGDLHYSLLKRVVSTVKRAEELEDIISILGIEEISKADQDLVKIAKQIKYYFTQNFFVAKDFTQKEGVYVPLAKSLKEIEMILDKKFIDVEPSKFLYINDINDVQM